jgi:hypothetical protein
LYEETAICKHIEHKEENISSSKDGRNGFLSIDNILIYNLCLICAKLTWKGLNVAQTLKFETTSNCTSKSMHNIKAKIIVKGWKTKEHG